MQWLEIRLFLFILEGKNVLSHGSFLAKLWTIGDTKHNNLSKATQSPYFEKTEKTLENVLENMAYYYEETKMV